MRYVKWIFVVLLVRYVKWIFVVLLVSSLTSFVSKDKPTGGLNVGDIAPDFKIQSMSDEQHELSNLKGKYVLLSFWASYDAQSRMQNASLSNVLRAASNQNVEMVSVSFDEYRSVFEETIRKDQIVTPVCFGAFVLSELIVPIGLTGGEWLIRGNEYNKKAPPALVATQGLEGLQCFYTSSYLGAFLYR